MEKSAVFSGGYGHIGQMQYGQLRPDCSTNTARIFKRLEVNLGMCQDPLSIRNTLLLTRDAVHKLKIFIFFQ